jgi:hypothetical protein
MWTIVEKIYIAYLSNDIQLLLMILQPIKSHKSYIEKGHIS